jgi:hypothetical protein
MKENPLFFLKHWQNEKKVDKSWKNWMKKIEGENKGLSQYWVSIPFFPKKLGERVG